MTAALLEFLFVTADKLAPPLADLCAAGVRCAAEQLVRSERR